MARSLRIEFPGGLYHVTSRGDGREAIYVCNRDRCVWLDLFGQVCERFDWSCYAWCQMTNHYHVVVETAGGNLARGMRHLNGVYAQYVNRVHAHVGHVFQGRYHAIVVDRDNYLLELARYVVLNPVRAALVKSAVDWRWSSYAATIGRGQRPPWLAVDRLLEKFGPRPGAATARYAGFIEAGLGRTSIWDELCGSIYLGSEDFASRMREKADAVQELSEVPRLQRRPVVRPLTYYAAEACNRNHAMALAYLSGEHTMRAIAKHFGVHYATVSRAVKTHESELRDL